jgi:hypothetical protein
VGHRAETPLGHGIDPKLSRPCRAQEAHRVADLEHHHVRLGRRIDPEAEPREPLREPARIRVVFGQAIQVVLERVETRRRQDAGLTHAAAEHLSHPVDAADHLGGAADE